MHHGLERCFFRYSSKGSIRLITARSRKKRKPPKVDEAIEKDVQQVLTALPTERFFAVPASITL